MSQLINALIREIGSLELQVKLDAPIRNKNVLTHLRKCLHMLRRTREVLEVSMRNAAREKLTAEADAEFMNQITEEMYK
jgi:hypothetical protein